MYALGQVPLSIRPGVCTVVTLGCVYVRRTLCIKGCICALLMEVLVLSRAADIKLCATPDFIPDFL
jgi:hypothetical protein